MPSISVLKDPLFIISVCNKIIIFGMRALVLLLPIFFLPWAFDALNFNKQALLIIVVFISLFAWMIKTLVAGKITFVATKVHIAVGIFLAASGIATIFSVDTYASFWGWSETTSHSFISVLCFALVYFLVAQNFSEKEIRHGLNLLGISAGLVLLVSVMQMLGLHILPFSITKANNFNTIGSLGGLGVFATVVLPLSILFSIASKKWWRMLFLINIILATLTLIIINYSFLWWLTIVASVAMILFWVIRRTVFDGRWLFLPTFFLIFSLFFVIFSPQIRWFPSKSLEFVLTHQVSYDVSLKTLKNSPILGSGPGTFSYDFLKYRNQNLNDGALWNVSFNSASSRVLTDTATTGIFGLVALLLLMVIPLTFGIRHFIFSPEGAPKNQSDFSKDLVLLSMLLLLITQTAAYFLYSSNLSLDAVYFFAMAAIIALISKNVKTYYLKPSSLMTLGVVVIFTMLFIFGLGFIILEGQRYVAETQYSQGLSAFRTGDKNDAISHLKKAMVNNKDSEVYLNQLALLSLSKLQDEAVLLSKKPNDLQAKTRIQVLISDAIGAATLATNINPNNIENWSTKGYVCQNLVGLVSDAVECAIASYDRAIALSPTNPYLLLQEGNTYVLQATSLPGENQGEKSTILAKAKDKFNAAIVLKKDYALAYYQLGLAYRALNDPGNAALAFKNAQTHAPSDPVLALQIGLAYYQDRNWMQAQTQFERALVLSPDYANALYFSGLAYSQIGENSKAIAAFERVLELNLGNENVQKIIANLRDGKAALSGLVPEPPAPLPSETPEKPTKKAP